MAIIMIEHKIIFKLISSSDNYLTPYWYFCMFAYFIDFSHSHTLTMTDVKSYQNVRGTTEQAKQIEIEKKKKTFIYFKLAKDISKHGHR